MNITTNRPLWRSLTFWGIIGLFVLFAAVTHYMPGDLSFELTNALVASVGFGVVLGFIKVICISLKKHPWEMQSDDMLVLGILMLAIGISVLFVGLWWYRITDDFEVLNYWVFLHARFAIVVGMTFLFASSGSVDGRIPPGTYLRAGAVLAAGVALLGLLVTLGIR